MSFGQKLRYLRKQYGLSREELAKKLGLSYWAIAKYETDSRVPDREIIKKIASLFKVKIDFLYDYEESCINDSRAPYWWHRDTPPSNIELEEFLKSANIYFDGAPLNEEDKEDILTYLKVKWEREKKKRERSR